MKEVPLMYKHRISTAIAAGATCLAVGFGAGPAIASSGPAPAALPTATEGPTSDAEVRSYSSKGFRDFDDNPWGSQYYLPVRWMQIHEISVGYEDGTYRKLKDVSRGESLAFLYRYLDPHVEAEGEPFPDVDEDHIFYEAIAWAEDEGVAYGYEDDYFKSWRDVTRAEFVSFLYRASGSDFDGDDGTRFDDVEDTSAHYDAISWAAARGIVNGYKNGDFRPNKPIVRGEVAKVMHYYAKTSR